VKALERNGLAGKSSLFDWKSGQQLSRVIPTEKNKSDDYASEVQNALAGWYGQLS
jgi:hypothetical protein